MGRVAPGKNLIILILGMLATISPFTIDMYLPAFSEIAAEFHTTSAKVSLSLSSYFASLAIGQLIYGPLLDRFGRKKPLYYGLTLYLLGSIGCMFSRNVEMLITLRFVQGLGGCVAWVSAMAMVRDFFPVDESARIFSLLVLVIGLSPLLAPTLGGFITTWLGWKWVFIALILIVILIIAATYFVLPEKYRPDPGISLRLRPMLKTYYSILVHPQFYTYALTGAFSFCSLFLYVAGSPIIFMEVFEVDPSSYGGIFALLAVGFVGSNQLNILMLRKFHSRQILFTGLLCQLATGLVFVIGSWYGWYGLVSTIVLFFISLSCIGFIYPNAQALALAPFSRNVGSASSLVGFIQIGIAGLASTSIGLINVNSSTPVAMMMFGTTLIALLILLAGRKKASLQPA